MKRSVSILSVVIFLLPLVGRGQWVQCNAPNSGTIYCFETQEGTLLAGTDGLNVFDLLGSTDSGFSWNYTGPVFPGPWVSALLSHGPYLFAIPGGSGLLRSSDTATTPVIEVDTSLHVGVHDMVMKDSFLFVGTDEGPTVAFEPDGSVYRSSDDAQTWERVNIGLPNALVRALTVVGNCILAATDSGVYRSSNDGESWTNSNAGLPAGFWQGVVNSFGVIGANCYATMSEYDSGLYRSTDSGQTWSQVAGGLPSAYWNCFAGDDSGLFVGGTGVYYSSDAGLTWSDASSGLQDANIEALTIFGGNIYAGSYGAGIYRRPLSDFGISSVAPQPTASLESLSAFPNPATASIMLRCTASESGYATITIVNALGAEVARIYSGELSAGEHSFEWDGSRFVPGMYEFVVRMNGKSESVPIILKE